MHFYFHQLQVNLSCYKKIIIKKTTSDLKLASPQIRNCWMHCPSCRT